MVKNTVVLKYPMANARHLKIKKFDLFRVILITFYHCGEIIDQDYFITRS